MLYYILAFSLLFIFIGLGALFGNWDFLTIFYIKKDYSLYKEYKALKKENKITPSIEMSHGSAYSDITQKIYGLCFILIGLLLNTIGSNF